MDRYTIESQVADLLIDLGVDLSDPNFRETPRRVAAHLIEVFEPLNDTFIDSMKRAVFPKKSDDMVTCSGIQAWGTCPHHIQHVAYRIDVAYIPGEFVIGLSKLPRLAIEVARLPILQEDITCVLADLLVDLLQTPHVAVVVEGKHSCISHRGVRQHDVVVTTAGMRGHFAMNSNNCKDEFQRYIDRSR